MDPIIAVDFDGTLVRHKHPEIGDEIVGAIDYCKRFADLGARLILYTMRSDERQPDYDGYPYTLSHAIEWCAKRGLKFWAHNCNPEQYVWTRSNKVYAHLYIDDAALGCPLVPVMGERSYVDWMRVGPMVMQWLEERKGEW